MDIDNTRGIGLNEASHCDGKKQKGCGIYMAKKIKTSKPKRRYSVVQTFYLNRSYAGFFCNEPVIVIEEKRYIKKRYCVGVRSLNNENVEHIKFIPIKLLRKKVGK